jgi:hypothetical protein
VKELAKKFLTPEQMLQIEVMDHQSELDPSIEEEF